MAQREIILITGNQIDYESGIELNYFNLINDKNEIEIKKEISDIYISQFYKFPNFSHFKILDFLKEYDKTIHYDQSIFNFWENINHHKVKKIEGNLQEIKCFSCNRIFSVKKMLGKKSCPKCNSGNIFHNIVFKNSSVNGYKSLLTDLGFKTMNGLFFEEKDKPGANNKNSIWNLNLRSNKQYLIILIGYNENILELSMYLKDMVKLKPENYKIHQLSIYNEKKIDNIKQTKCKFISENIVEFLEEVKKDVFLQ